MTTCDEVAAREPTQRMSVGDVVSQHSDEKRCPALKSKCHKNGHWERKCQKSSLKQSGKSQVNSLNKHTSLALSIMRIKKFNYGLWTMSLTINNVVVAIEIDTGADTTIIDQGTFKKMSAKIQLGPPDHGGINITGESEKPRPPFISMAHARQPNSA